eukprot:TRINITY_DN28941_c0_g1_i1.p2 TRINITY_DN28941_c0_g1~~TRINITY_DN28941_c0_g1_i1.p2  ORF type:complete len:452 (+),score=108.90 TRINITY_DN28941_c0_g1_i1:90-1358(+)
MGDAVRCRVLQLRHLDEPLGVGFRRHGDGRGQCEVVVVGVQPGGAWERSGLPASAAVQQLGDYPVRTPAELRNALQCTREWCAAQGEEGPVELQLWLRAPQSAYETESGTSGQTPLPPPTCDPSSELDQMDEDGFERLRPQPGAPPQAQEPAAPAPAGPLEPRRLARLVLDAFDLNGDDRLSRSEFGAFLHTISADPVTAQEVDSNFPRDYGLQGLARDLAAAPEADRRHIANACAEEIRLYGVARTRARPRLAGPPFLLPQGPPLAGGAAAPAAGAGAGGPPVVAAAAAGLSEGPQLFPPPSGPLPTCWGGPPPGVDGGKTVVVDLARGSTRQLRRALVRLGSALEGRLVATERNQERVSRTLWQLEQEAIQRFGCGFEALLAAAPSRPDINEWAVPRMERMRWELLPSVAPGFHSGGLGR